MKPIRNTGNCPRISVHRYAVTGYGLGDHADMPHCSNSNDLDYFTRALMHPKRASIFFLFTLSMRLSKFRSSPWRSCWKHSIARTPQTKHRISLSRYVTVFSNNTKQDRHCTYNVTMERVRATSVAVEKQYYMF